MDPPSEKCSALLRALVESQPTKAKLKPSQSKRLFYFKNRRVSPPEPSSSIVPSRSSPIKIAPVSRKSSTCASRQKSKQISSSLKVNRRPRKHCTKEEFETYDTGLFRKLYLLPTLFESGLYTNIKSCHISYTSLTMFTLHLVQTRMRALL